MAAKLCEDTIAMSGQVTTINDDGIVTVRLDGYGTSVTTRATPRAGRETEGGAGRVEEAVCGAGLTDAGTTSVLAADRTSAARDVSTSGLLILPGICRKMRFCPPSLGPP